MKQSKLQQGLTLIEVLIASVILLILLGLITNGLQTSGSVVSTITSQSELLEDTRFSGQIISEELAKAITIYESGTITLPTSYATQNPTTQTSVWTVGSRTAPILAFIQPPESNSGGTCDVATAPTNCLTFIAYYPVLRSTATASNVPEDERLKENSQNDDAWVIFEFRSPINASRFSTASRTGDIRLKPFTFASGDTSPLVDYVKPTTTSTALGDEGFAITFDECSINDVNSTGKNKFVSCSSTQELSDEDRHGYWTSVRGGSFSLRSQLIEQGKTTKTSTLKFAIAPRNATPAKAN